MNRLRGKGKRVVGIFYKVVFISQGRFLCGSDIGVEPWMKWERKQRGCPGKRPVGMPPNVWTAWRYVGQRLKSLPLWWFLAVNTDGDSITYIISDFTELLRVLSQLRFVGNMSIIREIPIRWCLYWWWWWPMCVWLYDKTALNNRGLKVHTL